jgi:predicted CDP-diglyceride synthetase/phosphatidate cytidylyltransferase
MRIGTAKQSYAHDESLFDTRTQWIWLGLLGVSLLVFPFVVDDYWLYLACLVAINIASATGLGAGLWWITPFTPLQAAGMALVITLMGFAGGLVMSAIKRDRGVTHWGQAGRSITGAAGLLDRVDAQVP